MASADCEGGLSPEQHALRSTGIGASEAAWILNVPICPALEHNEHGNPLKLYRLKTQAVEREPMTDVQRWGLIHEPSIASEFERTTGMALLPSPGTLRHEVHPWLLATPDRTVRPTMEPLELKTARTAEGWGRVGTDEIPGAYCVQVHQQMMVLGVERAWVAVLIGGSDFRWYEIPRSERLCGILLDVVRRFWEMVQSRTPPEPDWTDPRTPELVQLLHRPTEGKRVALDGFATIHADSYELLGRNVSDLGKQREEAKARLAAMLGDAEYGELPDGRVVRRQVQHVAAEEAPRKAFDKTVFSIRPPKKKR